MKRLIFLKVAYGEKAEPALKQFRSALQSLPDIKIIKEYPPKPEVLVEFPESKWDRVYEDLRKLDIVATIDSILPKGE
jgi:phage terminase small subunit